MAKSKKNIVKIADTVIPKENVAERKKALEASIKEIEKNYGVGSIMRLGDFKVENVEVIPTGSLGLDIALGIGGIPRGRIVEIFGPESSGKTTLTLHIIAECQKMGGEAAFIDAEHALDPIYARNIGVDINKLIVSQPDSGEEGLAIAEHLLRSTAIDLIVIDSVAALVPKTEIEGTIGDQTIGLQARLMSQALRKLAGIASKTNSTIIFINQLREKVGTYGAPETTPGGRALKFYSSVRIDIRKKDVVLKGSDIIGALTRAKVIKNKMAPPFKEAMFEIMFGKGISKEGNIIDLAVDLEIIEQKGSWYSYNGKMLAQGKEKTKEYLSEHLDLKKTIEDLVVEKSKQLVGYGSMDKAELESEEGVEDSETENENEAEVEE